MEALVSIAGITGLAFVNKKVVERLVKWLAFLKGDLITLASVLVGWGLAWLFSIDPTSAVAEFIGTPIRVIPIWGLYLIAGFIIAFAAGYLADREELRFRTAQAPGQSITASVPEAAPVDY